MGEVEIWRNIPGYEGSYQVSDQGRVKSLARSGQGGRSIDFIMSPGLSSGYFKISLCSKGRSKAAQIHRLVALLFIPNPENKPEVNHINGVKLDNRVCNLEWCTSSENTLHGLKLGIMNTAKGEQKLVCSKLKNVEVLKIRENLRLGIPGSQLAKDYGVNKATIYAIKSGKTWKHI